MRGQHLLKWWRHATFTDEQLQEALKLQAWASNLRRELTDDEKQLLVTDWKDTCRKALHHASNIGDLENVHRILSSEVALNSLTDQVDSLLLDKSGLTALHRAASAGHSDIVRALLARGAAVDGHSAIRAKAARKGWTPLLAALRKGQLAAAQELIIAGADVNVVTDDDQSALRQCCALDPYTQLQDNSQAATVVTVKMLLAANANLNQADTTCGLTPLHIAVNNAAMREGQQELISVLLEAGAHNAVDLNGVSVLHLACVNGHAQTVRNLLTFKHASGRAFVSREELDFVTLNGCTPLHAATTVNNAAIIVLLLEHGAGHRANCTNKQGTTPFTRATACVAKHGGEIPVHLSAAARDAAAQGGQQARCSSPSPSTECTCCYKLHRIKIVGPVSTSEMILSVMTVCMCVFQEPQSSETSCQYFD